MARREQGSHLMVQLQPHLRVGVAHGSICSRAGAPLGGVPRASGLEPPPCTLGGAVWSPSLLSIPPTASRSLCACLPTSLPPTAGHRLSCSQMAWSWASAAGLELRRRRCVRGRRWGAVGGALGVSRLELPAVRASVLRPWVCSSCGRLEISLSLGGVLGQRLGPGMWCPPPYVWDSGEKATWARARDAEKEGNGLN